MTTQIKDLPENKSDTPAARLKVARENKGLTRRSLSKITGIPTSSIEKYEYGKAEPGFTRLKVLCSALDIEASDVLELDIEKSVEQQSPTFNDDYLVTGGDTGNTDNYISGCMVHLDALDKLREAGFNKSTRKVCAHYEALKSALCFLEYDEIKELAQFREIKFVETSSEMTTKDEQEKLQMDCEELVSRIVDTAIFGIDLYSIELKSLSDMAEDYDLAPNRIIWVGWRGHKEIAPEIRNMFLEKHLQGVSEEDFLDQKKFVPLK